MACGSGCELREDAQSQKRRASLGRGQHHKSLSNGMHTRESLSGEQGQVGDWARREAPSLVRICLRVGDYKLHGIEERCL